MKARWREHEMIFVTIIAFAEMVVPQVEGLILQSSAILLFYIGYLSINLLIIPSIKKITFNDFERLYFLKPVLLIIVTSYLLTIGASIISYHAHPHLVNYAGYQTLAWLGYNDNPLANLFFGFDRAIWLVMLFTFLGGSREFMTWLIESPGTSREFRILVTNNIIPLLFIYFLALYFTNPIHSLFLDYTGWFIPALAIYIYLSFWLFPFSEKNTFWQIPVLIRLLISTFAGAVFSAIISPAGKKMLEFSVYWLFLLFMLTPLTWLLYRQRRDKILQLKGMEAALAKSSSDLQFLRSQINPHFLFNALNTLYGTAIMEKSEQTAEGLQKLGDMMRFMLHENNQDFIQMNKEIEYLKNYIALQKLRIPASAEIRVEHNIDDAICNRTIAPMLLIPFVENAFKHGISLQEKSWIDIKLECNETFICFEVRNSIHTRPENDTEKDKSGIGLKNVAERLRHIYANKYELQAGENGNEFIAKLVIK